MKNLLFLLAICGLVFACNDDDANNSSNNNEVVGLSTAMSNNDFLETDRNIQDALNAAGPVSIIAQISHTGNAIANGLALRNTKVLLFGNPMLGTPLMQENQLAGLDLPQKMLIHENAEGNVFVSYNNAEYLKNRHDLQNTTELDNISTALSTFASTAAGAQVTMVGAGSITANQGIVVKQSSNNFGETYTRLMNALNANPNITVVTELDHSANAEMVNLDLRPTRLVVFGNPALGTPIMQSSQTTGIDLPQKMLVYEDENGDVFVAYNNINYIAARHDASSTTLEMVSTALDNFSNAAISQ